MNWNKQLVSKYKVLTGLEGRSLYNQQYLFKQCIGVPKIFSKFYASIITDSIVYNTVNLIIPKDSKHINPLFLYLNSEYINYIISIMINKAATLGVHHLKNVKIPKFTDDDILTANEYVEKIKHNPTDLKKYVEDYFLTIKDKI